MIKNFALMIGVLSLSATIASAQSSLAEIDSSLKTIVIQEIERTFPNENNLLDQLECTASKNEDNKLDCVFEFGIYRCEDGQMVTRWIDLSIDLSLPSTPAVQLANAVSGECD